ncbi:MAG: hypothetical protein MH132_06095 [Hydrotalea sp.]|nr:hypothetical protein [Hydrotalea sp.]
MNFKSILSKLNKKEKIFISLLAGWTFIHFVFLIYAKGSTSFFWPFDEDPILIADYDLTEFSVYGITPWICLYVYKLLNNK